MQADVGKRSKQNVETSTFLRINRQLSTKFCHNDGSFI